MTNQSTFLFIYPPVDRTVRPTKYAKCMDKLLQYLMFVFIALALASCGGDEKDEPNNPNEPNSANQITAEMIYSQGTRWKGVYEGYTGARNELITIDFYSDGSLRIWWSHYKNMDIQYLSGEYSISNNKITIDGLYCVQGEYPEFEYKRTVPISMSDDKKSIKFEFDCDTWILTTQWY